MDAGRARALSLQAAVDASGDAAYEWNLLTGRLCWLTDESRLSAFLDLSELDAGELFLARLEPASVSKLRNAHATAAESDGRFCCTYAVRGRDSESHWVEDRGQVVTIDHGERVAVGTLRVVGGAHGFEQGQSDSQTGFSGDDDHRRLMSALDYALDYSLSTRTAGLLVKVGIDNLAVIRDTYGPDVAEQTVGAVRRELDRCLSASDVLGRIEQAAFAAVLSPRGAQDVSATTERILLAAQQASVVTEIGHLPVTASVGAVSFPDSVQTAQEAIAKADVALAQARRTGTNCFSLYDLSASQFRDIRNDLAVAELVQTALRTRSFALHFQPVVDASTGERRLFECLLRMNTPDGRRIAATEFIGVAERIGLARSIDRLVLDLVATELEEDPTVSLAMNISGLSTTDPSWLRLLLNKIGQRPQLAERLLIEITETSALMDLNQTVRFLAAVRDVGCRVALDDFGAGYTSFRHLQELGVDVVKIDGSFVRTLVERPDSRLFVKTLQSFADGLDLTTVAEGVESHAVGSLAKQLGVGFLQGIYYGAPAPRPSQPCSTQADPKKAVCA
jgi:diguanylate cyclase (GGDEF)-like protein